MNKIATIMAEKWIVGLAMPVITYITEKGWANVKKITDSDLESVKGTQIMTKNFQISLINTAREICNTCDMLNDFFPYVASLKDDADITIYRDDVHECTWDQILSDAGLDEEDVPTGIMISGRITII